LSKGQRALAASFDASRKQEEAHYQADRTALQEKSPALLAREREYKAHEDWKAGLDYSKPPPGLIALDYAAPAQRQAMREKLFNPSMNTPTGIAGLAGTGMDSVAVQNTNAVLKDEQDRDAATSYEQDVRAEDAYQRGDNAWNLISNDFQRKSTLLNSSQAQSQFFTGARINAQPQSIVPGILAGGLSAVGSIFGGPIGGALAGRIGGLAAPARQAAFSVGKQAMAGVVGRQ
jgi:hypothetical protein